MRDAMMCPQCGRPDVQSVDCHFPCDGAFPGDHFLGCVDCGWRSRTLRSSEPPERGLP
jgi:hypothetical protein